MKLLLVSLAITGCASAGPGNSIIGGLDDAAPGDGRDLPAVDAREVDASPRSVTLDQNASSAIKGNNSFACVATVQDHTPANSYYRVFPLADFNVTSTLHVTEVVFGVEFAHAETGGMQPATLRLGNYRGTAGTTIDPAMIAPLGMMQIMINDTATGDRVTVPFGIDVPAGTNLVVQLDLPASATAFNEFYMGSNSAGERKPGYWGATTCDLDPPKAFASMTDLDHEVDILMTVSGTM
jgi:hypothetical protein